jgi:predicted RNA-binding protein with PIN domain
VTGVGEGAPGSGRLVVDAANVIGSRPDGWWRDRAGAVRRLLTVLSEWRGADQDVVLVVEGKARSGVSAGSVDGVRVVHAQGSGDDEIVRMVADAARSGGTGPVTVVTADRALRERVTALGADTAGPTWLWQQLDAV